MPLEHTCAWSGHRQPATQATIFLLLWAPNLIDSECRVCIIIICAHVHHHQQMASWYCVECGDNAGLCSPNTGRTCFQYHLENELPSCKTLCNSSRTRLLFLAPECVCVMISQWPAVLHRHHTLYHFLYLPVYVCNDLFVLSLWDSIHLFFSGCVCVIISKLNVALYCCHIV